MLIFWVLMKLLLMYSGCSSFCASGVYLLNYDGRHHQRESTEKKPRLFFVESEAN